MVRLPVNVYELLSKINKVGNHLNAQPDRQKPATYAEIGESSCAQPARAVDAQRMSACCATEYVGLLQWGLHSIHPVCSWGRFLDVESELVSVLTLFLFSRCSARAGHASREGDAGGACVAGGQEPGHAGGPVGQP